MAWGDTYTEGDEWTTPAVYLPFIRAVNERLAVLRAFFPNEWGNYPFRPEDQEGQDAAGFWFGLQNLVLQMAPFFIDPEADPVGKQRSGQYGNIYPYADWSPRRVIGPWSENGESGHLSLPPPNGYSYVREREIRTLADVTDPVCTQPGPSFPVPVPHQDGHVARFVATTSQTPADQWQHGTKVFRRSGGAWVEVDAAAEPGVFPDELTNYVYGWSGSMAGPHLLDDLQAAIRRLTTIHGGASIAVTAESKNGGSHDHFYDPGYPGRWCPTIEEAYGEAVDSLGDATPTATWDGGASASTSWNGDYPYVGPGGYAVIVGSYSADLELQSVESPCARSINVYLAGDLPGQPSLYGRGRAAFDPAGTSLQQERLTLHQTVGPVSSGGPWGLLALGQAGTVPAAPNVAPESFETRIAGYRTNWAASLVITRFDVPGGFEYV